MSGSACLLNAVLIHAEFARGGDDGSPSVVRQRNAICQSLGTRTLFGFTRDENLAAGFVRLGAFEEGYVAGDVGRKHILWIDDLGIDVKRQHTVAAEAVAAAGRIAAGGA